MKGIKSIYFIGIKGAGMSALAILCKQQGLKVIGSDIAEIFPTDKLLEDAKIQILEGFKKENLEVVTFDCVVISAAYGRENVEVKEAKKRKIPIYYYSEFLGKILSSKRLISVCGIHGKTTTTAILSHILKEAGVDPGFLLGANCRNLQTTAHWGKGDFFILESDEYRKSPDDSTSKLFDFWPEIVLITSLEMDHPDLFSNEKDIYQIFYKFITRLPRWGLVIANLDYGWLKKLKNSISDRKFETYGRALSVDWQIIEEEIAPLATTFKLIHQREELGPFVLNVAGSHNIDNASAAIICALKLSVPLPTIKRALPKFKGVERRFQLVGETPTGTKVFDDYAHHPTAIVKTIETAKKIFPKNKIWVVFQPHTYSRTKKLLQDFAQSFQAADHVILADIFASAREKETTINIQQLVIATRRYQKDVRYLGKDENISRFLKGMTKKNDIIIVMGAGDIYKIEKELIKNDIG